MCKVKTNPSGTVTISRGDYERLKKAQKELVELKGIEKDNEILSNTLAALMFDSKKGQKLAKEKALMHSDSMKVMRDEIDHLAVESRGQKTWMQKTIDLWTWDHRK